KGLEKNAMQAMLVFAAMNLKKLATWSWRKNTPPTPKSPKSIHLFIINKTPLRIIFSKAFCLRSGAVGYTAIFIKLNLHLSTSF
ncbi:hypothetical protein ACI7XA_13895, partial [Shouchella clausii]